MEILECYRIEREKRKAEIKEMLDKWLEDVTKSNPRPESVECATRLYESALQELDAGTYGICQEGGCAIPPWQLGNPIAPHAYCHWCRSNLQHMQYGYRLLPF